MDRTWIKIGYEMTSKAHCDISIVARQDVRFKIQKMVRNEVEDKIGKRDFFLTNEICICVLNRLK